LAWNGDKTTTAGRGDNDPVFAKLFHFLNVLDGELQLKNAVAGPDSFERGRGVCCGWDVPGNQQRGNRNVSVGQVSMEVTREKKTKPRNARHTPNIIRILSCLDRYLAVTPRARPTCIINKDYNTAFTYMSPALVTPLRVGYTPVRCMQEQVD
jgi:hypothetical protein